VVKPPEKELLVKDLMAIKERLILREAMPVAVVEQGKFIK
jgi:hypothetical protein